MEEILVDDEGRCQYYDELEKLKNLSLINSSVGSESYTSSVGDGWHDNFAFEESMRESVKIVSRIDRMIEEEMYLKVVHRKNYHNDIIDIGDILTVLVIYDEDDKEEYTIKLTGKYLPNTDSLINEISLNSPIGRCIYLKNIYDDIYYYVNDKRIDIKVIKKDNMFTI